MNSEQPVNGLRFELLARDGAPADSVAYDVTLTGPVGVWTGAVAVALADGAVTFELPDGVPAWANTTLQAFLRSEWRARRDDASGPWPRRITRWRAPREG